MDKGNFETPLGELIPLLIPLSGSKAVDDWAFVPKPLPERWTIPLELWPTLAEAKEELARLDGVGRHVPNHELLLRPLQRREALRSSSLEGTYATPEQLLLFELDPRQPTSPHDPASAWQEVFNYGVALAEGQAMITRGADVSLYLVRSLHHHLMQGVRGQEKEPGKFREGQVYIGTDRRYVPPPPYRLGECLVELERNLLGRKARSDPLIDCFMVHYQFEAIHPFSDGNGRVGRLLLSLMIYLRCRLNSPWLYLSAYFDRNKDQYIDFMFRVSAKGDWLSWLKFCLRGTIEQAQDATHRLDNLVALKEDHYRRVDQLGGHRLRPIIDRLFTTPIITIPLASERFSVSYPSAKSDIDKLQAVQILRPLGKGRPQHFIAPEIIQVAYSD